MGKTHLIEDESLGGVLREYVEVERKPKAGDIIRLNRGGIDVTKGKTYEIKDVSGNEIKFYDDIRDLHFWEYPSEEYSVIEPTDVIHVDGTRYCMLEGKAKAGDKVIITNEYDFYSKFDKGDILTVDNIDTLGDVYSNNYRVLKPIEPTEQPVEVTESDASPSVIDMLANLARRMTSLEEQLKDTQSNVESLSYELENVKHKAETNEDLTFEEFLNAYKLYRAYKGER
jgi:hypothetical protein